MKSAVLPFLPLLVSSPTTNGTFEDAVEWGKQLERERGFWVVEIDIVDKIANELFKIDLLDGIGPARYAELAELTDAIIVDAKFVKHS